MAYIDIIAQGAAVKAAARTAPRIVNADAAPGDIIRSIARHQGWMLTRAVNETSARIGVSRRAIWDWLNESTVPLAQNRLALYYAQFEPGTEIEVFEGEPDYRMHALAVFQAGLKPKLVAICKAEDGADS